MYFILSSLNNSFNKRSDYILVHFGQIIDIIQKKTAECDAALTMVTTQVRCLATKSFAMTAVFHID